jgi:alkanesulfonate monooxygenase SsuD/methylene tetrahydromethanopterin reductase-like flavin-dependent oxidoreductase (luciferase family)
MKIGLALPQYDYSVAGESKLAWSTVIDWAHHAERLGLHSLWLADHLSLSIAKYGGPPDPYFGYDPIVGLANIARATERVMLGTLVLCAQLRPPKLLARQLDTLQGVAGGRLVPGFGAGWYEAEYRAAGVSFERPGRRLEQLADVLRAVEEHDPSLPRWVGGRGDRLLEVVARHGTGWNTVWAWTPEDYRERLDVLHRACDRVGRDPGEITPTVGLFALVGEDESDLRRRFRRLQERTPSGALDGISLDEWKRGRLVGTVDQVRDQLAQWESLGVAEVIAGLGAVPFSVTDPDDLELLASAIHP